MKSCRAARFLCAFGFTLLAAHPRVARAEDDATVEMARQRFREGVQFYDQRQYEKARLAFLQAYALKPHPSVLLNLAQSELRAGHPDDSATHFGEYLRLSPEGSDAERQEAELGFAAAKNKVGEVTISVDTTGAQVSVDGADKGVAPLPGPLYVPPGTHSVEARSSDRRASKSITVNAGQSVALNLTLRSSAAQGALVAPPPAAAGAEEPADEESGSPSPPILEETPPATLESPPADTSGGRKPFFTWFFDSPLAIAGAVVGVAGVGTGIGFGLAAQQDYANADSRKKDLTDGWTLRQKNGVIDSLAFSDRGIKAAPCALPSNAPAIVGQNRYGTYVTLCQEYTDFANAGDKKKTIAILSTAIGGAALVGVVVYYFLDPSASKTTAARDGFRARLSPVDLGGGATGIGATGSF